VSEPVTERSELWDELWCKSKAAFHDGATPSDADAAPPPPLSIDDVTASGADQINHELFTEPQLRILERCRAAGRPEPEWASRARAAAGIGQDGEYKSRLKSADERRNKPDMEWLVYRVIARGSVVHFPAPSYTGKSLIALDLALRKANGLGEWCGGSVGEPGDVVYVAMEGKYDLGHREVGWLDAHPNTTGDRLYTLEEEALDLNDDASIERFKRDMAALDVHPALIIIDTQALATLGADEDSNGEMNAVFGRCKRLAQELDCAVMLVHHTGHRDASRARGAKSQFDASDAVIIAEKAANDSVGRLHVRKVKAYKPHGPYAFEIVDAVVGVDNQGRPIESAYVRPVELSLAGAAARSVDVRERVLDAVRSAGVLGLTKNKVVDVVGRNKADVLRSIAEMLDEGLLRVRVTARGHYLTVVES
jgi:hypothetical protein